MGITQLSHVVMRQTIGHTRPLQTIAKDIQLRHIRGSMAAAGQTHKMTDDELVANMATELGHAAFHELFDRYYTPLTLFALRFLADDDAASDAVQNVFVSLYEQRLSSKPANVKSFLYTAVRNACLNVLKHEKVRRQYESQALMMSDDMAQDAADSLIEESEAQAKVAKALAQLPEQCRKIFMLNRFDGMSNQEIADALGISKRTVETQVSNALKILRRILLHVAILILPNAL